MGVFCGFDLHGETASSQNTIYDSDPKHLWNRLNETLFVRTAADGKKYGLDELDILYWATTKHLLVEPSHHQALAILDEFINTRGEQLIREPLKRALLQRDLWELFDWSATPWRNANFAREREQLQQRLVVAIRRVALTTNEIASLPDNYAQATAKLMADLPPGLFQTNGAWVSLGINGEDLAASAHVAFFNGHSVFCVMLHLPDGRQAAISYLDKLRSFAQLEHVWIYQTNRFSWVSTNSPREILELNPDLPQFPKRTEWALVRRMCVIDTDGNTQPTPVTESIQLRRYLAIEGMNQVSRGAQQFFEFELDRRQNGALRAIGKNEMGFTFVHFMGKGIDLFESSFRNQSNDRSLRDSATLQAVRLNSCFQCHSAPGIFSVNSYTRFLSPSSQRGPADFANLGIEREVTLTVNWKQRRFDWGLLHGLWRNADN